MTPNWREVPFVRILLPFALGILFTLLSEKAIPFAWLFIGICFIGALIVKFIRMDYRYRWVFGALVNLSLFLLGSQLATSHDDRRLSDFVGHQLSDSLQIVSAHLLTVPEKGNKIKATVAVHAISKDGTTFSPASGKMLVYLSPNLFVDELAYGDLILFQSYINPIPASTNPHAFDYQQYLARKGVHHQAFVKEKSWTISGGNQANPVLRATYQLRAQLIERLRNQLLTENEFSVAAALVLGYRAELSDELSNAYSGTGAMHVLAVSGLHVGLVYLFLSFLLGFLPGKFSRRILKPVLLLAGIWAFALLTGSSASVLRAATMFSFVIIGTASRRFSSIYNTLASSAFLLLCLNPGLLLDVSFQLSYTALLGIIYFQPKVYALWEIQNYLGDRIWALVAVSIAAQLGTLPITLYYFHQFPLLFWLSGVVVVPMAMLLLPLGILVLAVHGVPVLGFYLGKLLFWLLWGMNSYIFLLQQVPGSLITGIWIGLGTAVLLYISLFCFSMLYEIRKAKWGLAGVFSLVVVAGIWSFGRIQQFHQKEITFYQISKGTAIDFVAGKELVGYQEGELSAKNLSFALQNNREALGIRQVKTVTFEDSLETANFYKNGPFIQFYNKKILLIDSIPSIPNQLEVDYVLIANKPRLKIAALLEGVTCKRIFLDGTNGFYNNRRWLAECVELGVPCWNLRDGAFQVLDF